MKILNAIGSFFKRLFTGHNMKAIAVTAERAVVTAADVSSGNIPGAIAEAGQVVDAAKSIKVAQAQQLFNDPAGRAEFERLRQAEWDTTTTNTVEKPTEATPTSSTPSLTVVK